MLTEASIDCERIKTLVFGIGLNTNIPTNQYPKTLAKESISLQSITGEQIRLHELTAKLLKVILGGYKKTISINLEEELLNQWEQVDELNGKQIQVTSGNEIFIGKAAGINTEGNLLIKLRNGRCREVYSGKIKIL